MALSKRKLLLANNLRINVFFSNNEFFDQNLAFRVPFYSMSAFEINLVRRIPKGFSFSWKDFCSSTSSLNECHFLRSPLTIPVFIFNRFSTGFKAWCTSAVADFFDRHAYNSKPSPWTTNGARAHSIHDRGFFRPFPPSYIFRICHLATITSCNLRRSPTGMDAKYWRSSVGRCKCDLTSPWECSCKGQWRRKCPKASACLRMFPQSSDAK